MSVNSKMTAIADAIREKTGDTALLTLDGMAAAIAGLELGSTDEMEIGTATATTNNALTITHSLASAPFFAFIYKRAGSIDDNRIIACGYRARDLTDFGYESATSFGMLQSKSSISMTCNASANQIVFSIDDGSSAFFSESYVYAVGII